MSTTGVQAPDGDTPAGAAPSSLRRKLTLSWIVGVVAFTVARFFVVGSTLSEYGINVWVFGFIDLVTAVPYALGLAKVAGSLVDGAGWSASGWGAVAAVSFLAPYLYIAIAGTNTTMPGTVYLVLALLICLFGFNAIRGVLRKVRAGRSLDPAA